MTAETVSIMTALKEGTWALHQDLENHQFQKLLAAGTLSREAYADWLEQMLCVHTALEDCLRRSAPHEPTLAAVVRDEQFQEANLRDDLRFLGRNPDQVTPLPATAAFIEDVRLAATRQPASLLGYHYVFEGSKNGGAFLARAVKQAYTFEGDEGTRYLNPYGEQQRARWASFKDVMTAQPISEPAAVEMVRAATQAFLAVARISGQLYQRMPATA